MVSQLSGWRLHLGRAYLLLMLLIGAALAGSWCSDRVGLAVGIAVFAVLTGVGGWLIYRPRLRVLLPIVAVPVIALTAGAFLAGSDDDDYVTPACRAAASPSTSSVAANECNNLIGAVLVSRP